MTFSNILRCCSIHLISALLYTHIYTYDYYMHIDVYTTGYATFADKSLSKKMAGSVGMYNTYCIHLKYA